MRRVMIAPAQRNGDDTLPPAPPVPGELIVTVSSDARDVFPSLIKSIPAGHTVALLGPGQELSPDPAIVPEVDVEIVAIDQAGLAYRNLSADGSTPVGPIKIRPWEEIERVHVY
jgi:hypothetical protein